MHTPLALTLRQLEVFLRIAEARSFSEAGKLLHVSQPALTRIIQQMEDALGAKLFDRDTRKVDLTPVGIQLLPIAKRVLNDVERACTEIRQFVDGARGKIYVAALPCVGSVMLSPIIAEFCKRYPGVDFHISESLAHNVSRQVADGTCDFGVAVRPAHEGALNYQHLVDDEIFVICLQNDPLALAATVPWSIFESRRFIAMGRNCDVRATVENTISALKLEAEPSLECDNVATARSLVESGFGLTVVSALMLPQIATGLLTARPLVQPRVSHSLGVITRSNRSIPPATREFLEVFIEQAPHKYKETTSACLTRTICEPLGIGVR